MKTKYHYLTLIFILTGIKVFAQTEPAIDASKPTNFYNAVNHALEFISRPQNGNLTGYRANLILAPSERHLLLAEIPLMYNTLSNKFGIGDVRARYFYLPYKNYSKFFGAFGPSVDIIAPTGNFKNGIGTGRWTIAPGIATGLMFSEVVQVFPILSYHYTSANMLDDDANANVPVKGGNIQFITVIVPSEKLYFQITPQFAQTYQGGEGTFSFIQELNVGYQLGPRTLIGAYVKRDFKTTLTQMSLGLTNYF